jgi:hypothetical protein
MGLPPTQPREKFCVGPFFDFAKAWQKRPFFAKRWQNSFPCFQMSQDQGKMAVFS